jgi:hypothetical protein
LSRLIPEGGGIVEWISKFAPPGAIAELEATFELPGRANVVYSLALGERRLSYYIDSERLSESGSSKRNGSNPKYVERTLSSAKLLHQAGGERDVHPLPHETVLSLFRDPNDPTPMNALANALTSVLFTPSTRAPFRKQEGERQLGAPRPILPMEAITSRLCSKIWSTAANSAQSTKPSRPFGRTLMG